MPDPFASILSQSISTVCKERSKYFSHNFANSEKKIREIFYGFVLCSYLSLVLMKGLSFYDTFGGIAN